MEFEEFKIRMEIINKRMAEISEMTANMAVVGTAHSGNEYFNSLVFAQEELMKKSERLLKLMQDAEK